MAEPLGFFDKMKESIKGVLIGIVLIPASFVVVYYASQREQASEVLEGAMPFEKAADAATKNKAVFMTGKLTSSPLGDGYIKPGPNLVISRTAEMYAYVAKEKEEGKDNNKKTVYSCELEWTNQPGTSANGKGCQDEYKRNPAQTLADFSGNTIPSLIFQSQTWPLTKDVGYTSMPSLQLTPDNLTGAYTIDGRYLYVEAACKANTPRVGCERFSYSGTSYDPSGEYTAIGTPANNQIGGFVSSEGESYLRVGPGSVDQVMKSLNSEDSMMTMILFGVSVLLLGFGMTMVVGPFLDLLKYIPIVGGFGAGLIKVVLFVVAFIVMGFSFLVIEYWYIVLALFAAGIIGLIMMIKKKKAAAA
ncbi:MAG: hypothetical protein H3C43_05525 [Leptonema sp. (in: Bacteria)]|nr:hypothetical protein [Leptonema sp. (in: bacteria)]